MDSKVVVAQELSLSKIIFEMDSKVVVDMVNSKKTRIRFRQPLHDDIISLL
jgi:hypothetical protein